MKLFVTLAMLALASTALAQPAPIEAVRPDSITTTIYRDRSGEPRIRVRYSIVYSDGIVEVSRPMERIYSESEALAAGYTQGQIDTILQAHELVEASVYSVNALPTPSPTPAPTPDPTPQPTSQP